MTYRDGSPLREPIDPDSFSSPQVEVPCVQIGPDARIDRGHEIGAIGLRAGAGKGAEALVTVHVRQADLEKLESELTSCGLHVWVAAGSSEGPKLLRLTDYLREGRTP